MLPGYLRERRWFAGKARHIRQASLAEFIPIGNQAALVFVRVEYTEGDPVIECSVVLDRSMQDMLLQSWGGVVRVFPAVPGAWADVSFEGLRAEGGYRVSASRKAGRTVAVAIRAERDGRLRLRDAFRGAPVTWSRGDMTKAHDDYLVFLRAGETLAGAASR